MKNKKRNNFIELVEMKKVIFFVSTFKWGFLLLFLFMVFEIYQKRKLNIKIYLCLLVCYSVEHCLQAIHKSKARVYKENSPVRIEHVN